MQWNFVEYSWERYIILGNLIIWKMRGCLSFPFQPFFCEKSSNHYWFNAHFYLMSNNWDSYPETLETFPIIHLPLTWHLRKILFILTFEGFLVFENESKSWKIFLFWYEIAMFVWGTSLPALPGRSWDPSLALPVWQAVARAGCLMHTASPGPGCQDRPDKSISKQSSVSSSYIINM